MNDVLLAGTFGRGAWTIPNLSASVMTPGKLEVDGDRIDEIVAPGTNFSPADAGWTPPAVADPWRRRRRTHRAGG